MLRIVGETQVLHIFTPVYLIRISRGHMSSLSSSFEAFSWVVTMNHFGTNESHINLFVFSIEYNSGWQNVFISHYCCNNSQITFFQSRGTSLLLYLSTQLIVEAQCQPHCGFTHAASNQTQWIFVDFKCFRKLRAKYFDLWPQLSRQFLAERHLFFQRSFF